MSNLVLNQKYDLCDLIQSRYDDVNDVFDIPDTNIKTVTISNPKAGGASITFQKTKDIVKRLFSFRGHTLYLWERIPIPVQSVMSKKLCTRYKNIYIQFN